MSKWIKKDDQVLVIAGNDKGRTGKVISRDKDRVIVEGINLRKKHMKSRTQGQPSKIVEMELAVHISNVKICDSDAKPIKLKVKISKNKTKKLVYLLDGKEKTYRTIYKQSEGKQ